MSVSIEQIKGKYLVMIRRIILLIFPLKHECSLDMPFQWTLMTTHNIHVPFMENII